MGLARDELAQFNVFYAKAQLLAANCSVFAHKMSPHISWESGLGTSVSVLRV